MLDEANPRAVIGDNKPPAYDKEAHTSLAERVESFLKATQLWLKQPKIETDEDAGRVTDQITGLRDLHKEVDAVRVQYKMPHDDAGNEVQAAFKPLLDKLDAASKALKPKLADFATAKAEREAEEKAKLAEAADKLAAEAEEKRKLAELDGDIGAQVEAEQEAKAAEAAAKEAAKPVQTNVKSASGVGRTVAMRTQKVVTINNSLALFMVLRDDPVVIDALQRVATARVRSKDYEKGPELPGITVTSQKVM